MSSRYTLSLFVDSLNGSTTAIPLHAEINRVCYVAEGQITIASRDFACAMSSNSAWCGREGHLKAGEDGARILRFELSGQEAMASGPIGQPLFRTTISLDPAKNYLMRCDRVNLPPGGERQLHVHAGPGIRYLMCGSFHVETAGQVYDIKPGGAWFETGPDPVYAAGSKTEPSSFIRLLVLPVEFLGQRSGRTVNAEDEDNGPASTTNVFIDTPIRLG